MQSGRKETLLEGERLLISFLRRRRIRRLASGLYVASSPKLHNSRRLARPRLSQLWNAAARGRDMERLPVVRSKPSMTRRIVNVILPILLIVAGVALYEGAFEFGTRPLVFWSGVSLITAGVLCMASDFFGL